MCIGLFSNQSQAVDIRDEKGRTPLINYVIKQEAEFTTINDDIDKLWDSCYEYVRVNDGFVSTKISDNVSYSTPVCRKELGRKISCTDQDIHAHRQREKDLQDTIGLSVGNVRTMADSGNLYVNSDDLDGYSAQSYCYTPELYNELRAQGAEFKLHVWTYFNPGYATLSVVGVVVAGGLITYTVLNGTANERK